MDATPATIPGQDDTITSPRVLAGFDGRWQGVDFLYQAAWEAERRQLPLSVVTVLRRRGELDRGTRGIQPDSVQSATTAWHRLSHALESLRLAFPTLTIRGFSMDEDDVTTDNYPLACATLLVIGAQGRRQQAALHLDSISRTLLKAARCPVLIVPEKTPGPAARVIGQRPFVLAGISGHPADVVGARMAMEEATRRHCDAHFLYSHAATATGSGLPAENPQTPPDHARPAWKVVQQALSGAGTPVPRVSVILTAEPPASALVHHSAGACAIVVGGRPGALSGLVRDSVTRDLVTTAPCPVLAVPRGTSAAKCGTANDQPEQPERPERPERPEQPGTISHTDPIRLAASTGSLGR